MIKKLKHHFKALLYCTVILLFPALGNAVDICVVRGLEFSIYNEVLEGFWKGLGQSPSSCNEVLEGKEALVEKKLETEKPKVILALGNSAILFIQKYFPQTPTVFGMATDPNKGSHLTGVITDVPYSEQIKMVQRVMPSLKSLGLIYSAANQSMASQFQQAAQSQGVKINAHAVNSPEESLNVVQNFQQEDLLWVLPDQGVVTNKNKGMLFKTARDKGLKVYAFSPIYLKGSDGADLSVSLDWRAHGAQIADLTKKVLQNPNSSYPIEKPNKVKVYLKRGRDGFTVGSSEVEYIP